MNWVDLTIVFVLGYFAVQGFNKPLFFEIFDLVGFLLSFLMSLQLYNFAAKLLESAVELPHSFANVLGFIFVWYITELFLFILIRIISKNYKEKMDLSGEKFLSVVPAVLRGLVLVAIVLILLATFPIQPRVKKDIQSSQLGSVILTKAYQLEAPIKNIFGGLANDSLAFMTIKPKTQERVDLGFEIDKFTFDRDLEVSMFVLVNKERSEAGISPLTYDAALAEVARRHSADMFLRGYFSHYSLDGKDVADRALASGVVYFVIGENLAFASTLELAHQGLMNSSGHRDNILSGDYNRMGIGVAKSEEYGIMFTQVFKD